MKSGTLSYMLGKIVYVDIKHSTQSVKGKLKLIDSHGVLIDIDSADTENEERIVSFIPHEEISFVFTSSKDNPEVNPND